MSLLRINQAHCCSIIAQFDDQRCDLCGNGKGIWVKDTSFVWQWWCMDCEHGPMDEKDDKCTRCGTKNSQFHGKDELTGWEDEDIESEVEEIW